MAGAGEARGAGRRAGPERGWDPVRKTRLAVHVLLWQLLALAGRGTAVYLEVGELEEKCFIQEIPEGTVVIGACARGIHWSGVAFLHPEWRRGASPPAPGGAMNGPSVLHLTSSPCCDARLWCVTQRLEGRVGEIWV